MIKKIIIGLFFIIVIIRIINLSNNKSYYEQIFQDKINIYVNGSSAPRGRIIDINGKVIVDNKPVKTIFYHKVKNSDELDISRKLADLIDKDFSYDETILKRYYYLNNKEEVNNLITKEEYDLYNKRKITDEELYNLKLQRISLKKIKALNKIDKKAAYIYDLMQKGYSYDNKIILKNVSDDLYNKIIDSNITGVFGGILWERTYPYGDTLRSILGSTGPITKETKDEYLNKGYDMSDIVGTSYLELQYEEYLKGKKAKYKVLENNTLKLISEEKQGNDIVLNIDIEVQKKLESILEKQMLKAKKEKNTGLYKESYAIVSDPLTGNIIAMSGKRYLKDNTFSDVTSNIINTSYTVGSVVKGATITVGYNNNLINEKTKVNDSCVKLYLVPKKCSYKRLGKVNDITALKESSNYFQFLIAIGLTGKKYHYNMKLNATRKHFDIYRDTLADYGLGVLTGIDLPNEKEGIKGNIISDDLLLNIAIGQYDTYTPIMLSTYINTIASDGYVRTPKLLSKVVKDNKVIYENNNYPIRKVNIEDKYLKRIKKGFNLVTTKGTARGYITNKTTSAGKTGTSQTVYKGKKTISTTFVGFFPYEDPKYSITIVSPNISTFKGNNTFISRVNRRISSDLSTYLLNK